MDRCCSRTCPQAEACALPHGLREVLRAQGLHELHAVAATPGLTALYRKNGFVFFERE